MNDRLLLFVLPATTNQLEAGQSNLCVVYMTKVSEYHPKSVKFLTKLLCSTR